MTSFESRRIGAGVWDKKSSSGDEGAKWIQMKAYDSDDRPLYDIRIKYLAKKLLAVHMLIFSKLLISGN